jgi:hypothetical protein
MVGMIEKFCDDEETSYRLKLRLNIIQDNILPMNIIYVIVVISS